MHPEETMTLLIVDDNHDNLLVFSQVLSEALPEARVVTAISGQEALKLAPVVKPDMALVDVQMPTMNGVELCGLMRANAEMAKIPIILITSHSSSVELRVEALEAGADDFISRPIDNQELIARVRTALRVRSAEDKLRTANDELEQRVAERTKELQEYQKAVQTSADMIAIVDSSYRFKMANPAFMGFTGGTDESMLGRSLPELLGEEFFTDQLKNSLDRCLAGEEANWEMSWRHSSGGVRDVEISFFPLGDDAGLAGEALITIKDISERKERERLLTAHVKLVEIANGSETVDQLLAAVLEEAQSITGSEAGFFHFVDEKRNKVFARVWSLENGDGFTWSPGDGEPATVAQGDLWSEALAYRRVVVNNECSSRDGCDILPERFASTKRELVVPILRGGEVVAVLGVLNKDRDYVESDAKRIERLAEMAWDIAARKRAEYALRKSEQNLKQVIDNTPVPMVFTDSSSKQLMFNRKFTQDYGYVAEDFTGLDDWWALAFPDEEARECARDNWLKAMEASKRDGTPFEPQTWEITCKDDSKRTAIFSMVALDELSVFTAVDITERLMLEQHLRQTQKMEAVGTLAGGIAHDFNNILGAILGYTELTLTATPCEYACKDNLNEVVKAAKRARELVKQILMFSRADGEKREPVKVGPIVAEAVKLIRQSIPTTIGMKLDIDKEAGVALADSTQIHQIVMNLGTNAYHAMRDTGGVLGIGLERVEVDKAMLAKLPGLSTGYYARITVSDTGVGISKENQQRIFEPFFTTKLVGEGTGMGLSVVHGIVQNFGGAIDLASTLGEGTTFTIYLPLVTQELKAEERESSEVRSGKGHILVVDDELVLTKMVAKMLKTLGYDVTAMTDSVAALKAVQADPMAFDLIITDQTMPFVTGDKLATSAMELRPELPVIICTGYSDMIDELKAKSLGIRALLMKPVDRKKMSEVVWKTLNTPQG